MSEDFKITGGAQFKDLSRRLKEQGTEGKELRRELNKAIREALQPLIAELREAEQAELPKRGGLAALVASQRISRTSTGSGVSLRQSGRSIKALKQMDAGRLRHPVFGNTKVWVTQAITPGFWTNTVNNAQTTAAVRAEIQRVMRETADKIQKD